jgi:hypothetical protein
MAASGSGQVVNIGSANKATVEIKAFREDAVIPKKATESAAGYDLCAWLKDQYDEQTLITPHSTMIVPTGLNVNIPNVTAPTGQAMYASFNVNTNGINSDGLQFEMKYDPTKVKFEEIVSNIQGPWLQYLTHDDVNGIIRFGGMNNQSAGSLTGNVTPFKLKWWILE